MGYTHYFETVQTIPQDAWDCMIEEAKKLLCAVNHNGVVLESEQEDGNYFIANKNMIRFNGDSSCGLDHETFLVKREKSNWDFCKTAKKPYDVAVCACLILIDNRCPGHLKISSDGSASDWQDGLMLANEVLKDSFKLPSQLR